MNKRLFLVTLLLAALCVLAIVPAQAQDETRIVSFLTTFGGSELDALNVSLNAFTEATGILVTVESNRSSTTVLRTRIAGGNPPDVALISSPAVVAEFARAGYLIPLVNVDGSAGLVDPSVITDNYNQAFIDLTTVDGAIYGIMAKAYSKSTVWYRPASFEEMGFEVPTTWDELMAIQQAYIDAGVTPWSIGAADAWTLTDWFENIYVRLVGPEMYNGLFLTHTVPWTDPTVVEAMQIFQQVFDPADTNLAGGTDGTLSTDFITAMNMVFGPDPSAAMYYEGGFVGGILGGNFPDLVAGEDYNFFLFPALNEAQGAPIVGGGDTLVAFSDRPEVAELINWMAGVEGNTLWAGTNAIISPNVNVDMGVYSTLAANEAQQVVNADAFVFDGSDLMPSAVTDAFHTGLQEIVADPSVIQETLEYIESVAASSY